MESGIVKNFEALCRLCLVSGVELADIFQETSTITRFGDNTSLANKIMVVTNLELQEEDELPHVMCKTCSLKVTRSYEFRMQAKRSDEILRRYLQSKKFKQQQQEKDQHYNNINSANVTQITNEKIGVPAVQLNSTQFYVKPEPQEYEMNTNESDNNCEQSMVMVMDPTESMIMMDDDEDDDDSLDSDEIKQAEITDENFQPIWMGNGQDDADNSQQMENDEDPNLWLCQYCNSKFATEERYQRHSLIHTPEPPFPCDYCEETFELRTDLKSHWRIHSDGNPHICQMCGKSFPDRMSYLKHSDLHDQVKPFRCPVCQKSFCYGSDLRKHAITHTGIRPYVCSVCGNSFTRSTSLNKHLRMHNGNRPFTCQQCPKIFGSRGDLKRHQIIHSGIKPWICTVCSVPFNRKDKLVRHERLHSGEPRPFQCYECPTSFSRKEDLTKHIQFHHYKPPKSKIAEREEGEKELIENNRLDKISTLDIEKGNRRFKMLIRETFSTPGNNWSGQTPPEENDDKNEAGDSHYKCDICHKNFTQKSSLDSHKNIHSAIKPFSCSMCEKSFYRRRELMRHEAVHTGYKPFSCGVCGKCFSRTDKLNRHVQTHEYKNTHRNFTCDVCNLNFRTIQELTTHRSFCCPDAVENDTSSGMYPEVLVKDDERPCMVQAPPPVFTGNCTTFIDNAPRMPAFTIQSIPRISSFNIESIPQDTLNKLENNPEILLLPIM